MMGRRTVKMQPLPHTAEQWQRHWRLRRAVRKVLRDPKRTKKAMQAAGLDITGRPA